MSTVDDAFTDALQRLLRDRSTPEVVGRIEAGGSPESLWHEIESSGFADALVPAAGGGAGLALSEVFGLFELCGRNALPVPLAQTMLARAVLAIGGHKRPTGSIALAEESSTVLPDPVAATMPAPSLATGLRCEHVAYGRVADHVLIATSGGDTILMSTSTAQREASVFPLDATLSWNDASIAGAVRVNDAPDPRMLDACATAAQIAGALMAVFERTLQYANERQQFGRPIGKFQAIQHQLAVLSEQACAARMAAQIGCQATDARPERLRVAVAKARTSEAAAEGAAIAHAVHGAIGLTAEYDLQLFTRRLHAWRQSAGSEGYWQTVLGEAALEGDEAALDLIRAVTSVPAPLTTSPSQ